MLISFQLRTNRNLPYKLDVFLVYWRRRMKLWMKVLSFCIIFAFMHSTCQIRDLSLCKFIQKFHGHWTYRFVNIRCNNLTFLLHFLSQFHSGQWLGAGGRCLVCLWFVTQLPPQHTLARSGPYILILIQYIPHKNRTLVRERPYQYLNVGISIKNI